MKTKMQIGLAVAVFIFSLKLSLSSSQDVINRNDFIKDHSVDIANIIREFYAILNPALPPMTPAGNASPAAAPFEPPLVCIISQDELTEIWNEIEKEESAEMGYPIKFTYSTNCNELEKIKTGILKMKHEFKELLKQQISSVKYEEMKATYENEIRLLLKRLDDERESAQGEQMEIVGELQNRLQKQQDEINKILKKLEDEQNALNEAYVALCVANIDRNEVDKAVGVFKNITNYREIKRIVSTTYSTKPESYEEIVLFVRQVADAEPVLLGYTCLFEELVNRNQLRDMRILVLGNELRTNDNLTFKELKDSVMRLTDEIIRKKDFEGFIDDANTKGSTRDVDFVKQVTQMIVQMYYIKPWPPLHSYYRNAEILMDLVPKFSNLHHQLYVINHLITAMKERGDINTSSISLIIYRVIEARNAVEKSNDKYVKGLFADIEKNLPESVRVLLSSNLCIKNLQSGEFLFTATTEFIYSHNTHMPATAKLTSAEEHDVFAHNFIFTKNGNEVQIRNVKSNQLVTADVFRARSIFPGRPGIPPSDADVDFILGVSGEGEFTIKSKTKGYWFPKAEETFQRGHFIEPRVSPFHEMDFLKQEMIFQKNGVWLIKQCE